MFHDVVVVVNMKIPTSLYNFEKMLFIFKYDSVIDDPMSYFS